MAASAGPLLNKDILFMLGSEEEAALLGAAARETGKTPRVHLKIDTGMGRYWFFFITGCRT